MTVVSTIQKNSITLVLDDSEAHDGSKTVSFDLGRLSTQSFDPQKVQNIVNVLKNYFYKPLLTVLYTRECRLSLRG